MRQKKRGYLPWIAAARVVGLGLLLAALLMPARSGFAADDFGRAEIAYSEGLLAYHQQQFEKAATRFARSLQLNPRNEQAAYFLGVAHYRLGNNDTARSFFVLARKLANPGPVQDLSESYIRSIDQGAEIGAVAQSESDETGRPLFAYASLSTSYDSNVPLNPDSLTLATLPSDKADAEFAIRGGGGYKLVQGEHYRMTPEAYYYQSLHPQLSGFNYGLAHVQLGNRFNFGKLGASVPVMYEFSMLGTSKFVQNGIVNPALSYFWLDRMLTQVGMQTTYSDFFMTAGGAQNRDALNIQPGLWQYVYFNDRKHYVSVGFNYENNFARGSDWQYSANTIALSTLLPLPAKVDLYVFGRLTLNMNFDNVDSIIGTKRKDTVYMAGATVSRKFKKVMDVSLHYNFWKDSSNQAFFTYMRNLVGVTFGVAY